MAEVVAPIRSRRLPFWAIIIALVICALAGVFMLLWFKLPTWAPAWVVEHSPWVDPIVRAVEAEQRWAAPRPLVDRASQRLLSMGEAARPALLESLKSPSRMMRTYALKLLLTRADERLVSPLVELLKREARELEARARKSGGASFIAENRDRFELVYEALVKQPPEQVATAIMPFPEGSDLEVAVIFELAGKISDDRLIPPLVNVLREPSGSGNELVSPVFGGRSIMAADALLNSPSPKAIPAVLPLLADPSAEIRRVVVGAVRSLYKPIPPVLVDPLCRSLADVDPEVRQMAAKAMVFVDDPAAEAGLIHLSHSDNVKDRYAAVFGLGSQFCSQRGLARLGECMLGDAEEGVRRAAVEALSRTKEALAIPLLLQALVAGTPLIRREACFALGRTDAKKEAVVQAALLAAMDDPDDATSESAEKTLTGLLLVPEMKIRVQAAVQRLKPRREQRARIHEEQ